MTKIPRSRAQEIAGASRSSSRSRTSVHRRDSVGLPLAGIGGPFLEALTDEQRAGLASGARRSVIEAGDPIFQDNDEQTGLVVSGITRLYLRGPDGRQLSVRYARRGALIGTVTGIRRSVARLTVQAVTRCEIIELDRTVFLALVASDAAVGRAVVEEVARRLQDIYGAIAITAFGSMRDRIVRHLLDVASGDRQTGLLVAPVTQQVLADAVGSVREVVARNLAMLREEGLIATNKGQIVLLDAQRLAASVAAWGDP